MRHNQVCHSLSVEIADATGVWPSVGRSGSRSVGRSVGRSVRPDGRSVGLSVGRLVRPSVRSSVRHKQAHTQTQVGTCALTCFSQSACSVSCLHQVCVGRSFAQAVTILVSRRRNILLMARLLHARSPVRPIRSARGSTLERVSGQRSATTTLAVTASPMLTTALSMHTRQHYVVCLHRFMHTCICTCRT